MESISESTDVERYVDEVLAGEKTSDVALESSNDLQINDAVLDNTSKNEGGNEALSTIDAPDESSTLITVLLDSLSFRSAVLYGVFRLLLQYDFLVVVMIIVLGNLAYWFFRSIPSRVKSRNVGGTVEEAKGIVVELPVAASLLFLENQDLHMDITINDLTNSLQVYVE